MLNDETYRYTYSADGIRTSKTVNGVKREYILNGTQILGEVWSDGTTIVYIYDAEGYAVGMLYRDSSYEANKFDAFFYERNLQGDIIAVYDCEDTKLVSYTYDAWGNVSTTYLNGGDLTGAQYNPFTYRGYYRDSETGFYYLNTRYYDAVIGRFINADGIVAGNAGALQGYNLYAYCFNNPVNLTDSEGNWPKWMKKAVAVVAVALVVTVAVVAATTIVSTGAVTALTSGAITGAFIVAAEVIQVTDLQIEKSKEDGDSTDEIVDDVLESIFDNGKTIVGALEFKLGTTFCGVAKQHFFTKPSLMQQAAKGGALGKVSPYIPCITLIPKLVETIYVVNNDDYQAMADKKGYILK